MNKKPFEVQNPEEKHELWEYSRQRGVSRRLFLQLLAIGGSAAVLAACGEGGGDQPTPTQAEVETPAAGETPVPVTGDDDQGFAKDTEPFIPRGTNLEARLELLPGWLTPTHLFFVRNNSPVSPRIDVNTWRLRVEGDGVQQPLELTYDEIRQMPSRTVPAYVECAGNQRNLFQMVMGQQAEGGEWVNGGVGMGVWTGVPLAHILQLAGIQDSTVDVNLQGLDTEAPEGGFQRPMTLEKAMDEDTILAWAMNGEDLPVDHGYPLRGIVPGWVGSNNVKWLGTITASTEQVWVRNNTSSYVLVGPEWPADQYAPAEGGPITTQVIKSTLALPWEAQLAAGPQIIRGFAFSPHAPIQTVEWSVDNGQTWQEARIVSPALLYSWVRFEFDWDAPGGEHGIMTRATDEQGNTQPDTMPFNQKGYLFNMVYPFPVTVS